MKQDFFNLEMNTNGQKLYEFTDQAINWIIKNKFNNGILNLNIQHTSASLIVQENADPDVQTNLINYLNTLSPRYKYFFCLHANETLSRLEQTPKLVIAALNGHTVGGGLEIAMAADIRIAHKGNFQIGLPEVSLGVLAGTGGTARLSRLVGKAKAMEIMVTGRKFSFEEARDMSLVHDIYDSISLDEFRMDVLDYAGQFTLPLAAAKAIGNIKRSVQSGIEIPLEYHLALERELQSDLFQSEDAKEGIASYVERRTPRFTGK